MWLDEAVCRLDNLLTVSDSVRDVRIQLEQMKVTAHPLLEYRLFFSASFLLSFSR